MSGQAVLEPGQQLAIDRTAQAVLMGRAYTFRTPTCLDSARRAADAGATRGRDEP